MNETRTRIPFSQHYYAENEDGTRTLSTPEGKILGVARKTEDGSWTVDGIGFTSVLHDIVHELASRVESSRRVATIRENGVNFAEYENGTRELFDSAGESLGMLTPIEGNPSLWLHDSDVTPRTMEENLHERLGGRTYAREQNMISDDDYTLPGTRLQVSKADYEGRNYVHSGRKVFGFISRVEGTPVGVFEDARGNVYGSMVAAAEAVCDAYYDALPPALTAAQYTEKMAAVPFQPDAMAALDSAIEKIKAGFESYLRQTHGHGLTDENHRAIFEAAVESNTNAADIETAYTHLAPGVRFSQNKN